ncbi:MAG: winged helix DNA-binding protein [Clostridia bacterium]|nr:winged helix DNA-binding protein [Clostridia bacterium]
MKVESVKLILDACAAASHVELMLPALPKGITPRCVRVIEQIAHLTKQDKAVKVSDISEMLDVTRPGITAVVRDLAEMGYVSKERDTVDNRIVYVSLTQSGWELYQAYVEEGHTRLAEVFSDIGDDGAEQLSNMIHKVLDLMQKDVKRRQER